MRTSRLWTLLLLPVGLAAGHLLGYAAAQAQGHAPSLTDGHDYVGILLLLAVPLSLLAMARVAVSGVRQERSPVGFTALALQQVAAYVAIEVLEHAAAGISPLTSLREATLVWGIVAQLVVAAVVAFLVRAVRTAARRLSIDRDPMGHGHRPTWGLAGYVGELVIVAVWSVSRRGPPLLSV